MAAPILCWRDTRRFEFSRISSRLAEQVLLTRREVGAARARAPDDTDAFRQRALSGRIRTFKSHKGSTSNFARKSGVRALVPLLSNGEDVPRAICVWARERRNSLEMRMVSPRRLELRAAHTKMFAAPRSGCVIRRGRNMIKPSTQHLLPRPSRPPVIRISSHTPCQPWIRYAECRRILPRLRERGERSNPPRAPRSSCSSGGSDEPRFGFGPARATGRTKRKSKPR
ncbi:hypothetical protein LXA43DRAFT_1036004 [Ganoderma leucocontextum]|nr:hypothetical protein LXA43DRAFT_1036004 [Ganoderma leucocontextum]